MSWESQETQGAVNIVSKLVSLPFQKVSHKVATLDAQPLGTDGIVISVTGQLLIDDETNPQFYTQTFVLKAEGGNYYVSNDIFRLIYA
ncbi:Nuclear transport factor 2 [Gamsiella multidivaricata]|nr:Nuclear transport factor 2 [Gamsiella multidivaricata]